MSTLANIALVNRDGTDFSDLNADLDAEITSEQAARAKAAGDFSAFYGDHKAPTGEICPKCKGKGRFMVDRRRNGRPTGLLKDCGPCFSCGGTGSVSAEKAKAMRAHTKGQVTKANNEQARRDALAAKIASFTAANPDLVEYCNRLQNEFTDNCLRQLRETGEMSVNRMTAIRRSLDQKSARDRAEAERTAAAAHAGSGLDLSPIPAGHYAVPNGDTRLKVLIEKPLNEDGKPTKWHGWVFVSDGAEYGQQRKYGRQAPGKTYSGMIQDELRAIVADPKAAAIAYGKLTGRCSVCNRKLENEESVARGIGPICAEKAGW